MTTPDPTHEQILRQTACRMASRGRGSLAFNLLFPGTLAAVFVCLYLVPMWISNMATEPLQTWLQLYLTWSPPFLVLSIYVIYTRVREAKIQLLIKQLREQDQRVASD